MTESPVNAPPPARPRTEAPTSAIKLAGLGFAGAWLILLIAGSVFVAVLIFSATQFQLRFANFVVDGGSLSIWKAEQLRAEWRASRDFSEIIVGQAKIALGESQKALTRALSARRQSQLAVSPARQALVTSRGPLLVKIQNIDEQFGKRLEAVSSFTRNADSVSSDEFLELIRPRATELLAKDPTIAADLQKYTEARRDWEQKAADNDNKTADLNELREANVQNQADLKRATDSGRLIISSNEEEKPEQRAQIENAIYEFDAMYGSRFGRLVYRLTLIPSDVLVLALVIIMGLLGSSLQLSYVYVTQFEAKNTSFYIIRPLFGVITAFVIFIVAKAGIPLIADPTRLGANAPINPYFISFLAIISGLLSERALVSLVRIGSNYFRESDTGEPLRWARGNLKDEFRKAGRDADQLRKLLKAKDAEWDEWLQGKEPMPSSVQTMLAAVLQKPRRDLFTDIPPDVSEPDSLKPVEKPKEEATDKQPKPGEQPEPDGKPAEQKEPGGEKPLDQEQPQGEQPPQKSY
jgi:hypothetical protein